MKQLQFKIVTMVLMTILIALIIPAHAFATEANMQIVKDEEGDYIIYVEGLAKTEFKFAISQLKDDPDLDYINSKEDGEKNQVAVIKQSTVTEGTNYIYIKNGEETTVNAIDFSNESQVFNIEKIKTVETTTNRIATNLLTNLEERNEVIDGVQYTETVGGLEIKTSSEDSKYTEIAYYYKSEKLPAEKYSELQDLVDELNGEKYLEKDMYSKIKFAKKFYNLYEELINDVDSAKVGTEDGWTEVTDMTIRQPIDAKKDDKYIVLMKKVAKNGTEINEVTYDAKFLISYREEEEEKIPERTETIVVQETAKLPITGDSIVLFVILGIIIVALIIVFIRMKKLKNKESEN